MVPCFLTFFKYSVMDNLFVNHNPQPKETTTKKNAFLSASTRKDTRTENGAISNSSTGADLVNDFSNAGAYRGRYRGRIRIVDG